LAGWSAVRAARAGDAQALARLSGSTSERAAATLGRASNLYLVAETKRGLCGYLELVHVRTLQYEGYWVESLHVSERPQRTTAALFAAAIEEAKRRPEIDEIGYLASPRRRIPYETCFSQGFSGIGAYSVFERELGDG